MTSLTIDRPLLPSAAQSALARALDPADPALTVVAWPGRVARQQLHAGDIVVRRALGGTEQSYVLAEAVDLTGQAAANAIDIAAAAHGGPLQTQLKLFGPDRMLRPDLIVLRGAPEADETTPPPPVSRPTIRRGSRGPAVAEAQQRLNRVDTRRYAQGQSRIERCPLVADAIFGSNTDGATRSFQRVAFPGMANEWDGIIGPRTWTALIGLSEQQQPPTPVLPPTPGRPPRVRLNPARWSRVLGPLATGRTQLRTGNAVTALMDGTDTFNAMAADMGATGEGDYIYLLGWDNFDDFRLGAASTFRAIYEDAANNRGVEVAAMLWDQPILATSPPGLNPADLSATAVVNRINRLPNGKAIKDDLTTNNTTASTVRLAIAAALIGAHPRLIAVILRIIEPDIARLTGSHHQKVLIVKRGARLVAYCGGIDMNPNRVRAVDPGTGQPHHDTHCRIEGPSAHDLLATFLARWAHHPESTSPVPRPLRGSATLVPAAITSPGADIAPFGGPVSVMIARTFNPVRTPVPSVVRERAIKPALLAAIAAAQRFIYIEDQYLVDLDTARALAARIPHLENVTVLIPGNPITDMPFREEYRRDFVELVHAAISGSDRDKFKVFQLSTSQSGPVFGDHTYVHSKSWVFDDEMAVIGTANCNRRSYTFDSEAAAFIFEDNREAGDPRKTFAQRYRIKLWRHHLGVLESAVETANRASFALWRSGTRPATAGVFEFDHSLPTSLFSTAGLRQEVMNRAATRLRSVVDPTTP